MLTTPVIQVVLNLLFPVLLYFSVFVTDGPFLPPTVGVVLPDHPADGKLFPGDRIMAVNGEDPMTFFEITTAAAFLAFAESPADAVLLEVGLGGRLDATNLVDRPAVTVITPVSIDHADRLGETLKEIAFEKAGILKADVPAIIAPQPSAALSSIEQVAAQVGGPGLVGQRSALILLILRATGQGQRFAGVVRAFCERAEIGV